MILHSVSFVLLVMLNCSNSVLLRGVFIDAEEPAGECVVFPVHYVRLFFQKERAKKQQRIQDAIESDELQTGLLEKTEKFQSQIVTNSKKSVEMMVIVSNRTNIEYGLTNGDPKANQ